MTYFYHYKNPDVRIKVTKKMVTWEELKTINLNDVIAGSEPKKEWKYYMRHKLPVNNSEMLREMYNLPEDVVAKLKGSA